MGLSEYTVKYKTKLDNQDILLISESGLFDRADLDRVYSAGANAVLVGESLMRQVNIENGLRGLIGI